jgi:hypothetical protein
MVSVFLRLSLGLITADGEVSPLSHDDFPQVVVQEERTNIGASKIGTNINIFDLNSFLSRKLC